MQRKQSTDQLLTMGLALYADKRTMEQRVRGIFGRKRTATFARALSAILALFICVGGFTTACLPVRGEVVMTHENELALVPVTHASATDETMPESVQAETASPLAETLGVPQPWRFDQTSADGLLRVTGNIAVTLPDAAAVPIATAVCREVTEADLARVSAAFFGQNDVAFTYAVQDTREYAEQYLEKDKALYESVLDGTCENRAPSFHKSVVKQYEAYAALAQTAPSASERRALSPVFTEHMNVTGDTYIGFRGVAVKDGVDYLVSAANLERASAVNIREAYEDYFLGYMNSFRTEPVGVSVTKEEAIAQATAMAAKVDDGLALCHVMPAGTHTDAGADPKVTRWAWQCVFMRAVNGVGTVYDSRDVGSDISSEVYGRVNEALEITIDDRGVCNVHWINPMTVTNVSDATLLPFSAITDALIEQLREKYNYDITQNETRALYLWRAELGLMRIGKPGAKSYTLEPVWSFFIEFDETPDTSDPALQRPAYDGDPAYWNALTVSAIDGRLLDRDRGY